MWTQNLSRFLATFLAIASFFFLVLFAFLIVHEVLHRQLGVWSPFLLPYADAIAAIGILAIGAYLVAKQTWAMGGRWAALLLITPLVAIQLRHNLFQADELSVFDTVEVLTLAICPVLAGFVFGNLGDKQRIRHQIKNEVDKTSASIESAK